MRASTRRGYREIVEGDLEIMPLMNLFVAMIPMLLISAVFLNVTVIDMKAPAEAEAAETRETERLNLTVAIEDTRFVISGRGVDTRAIDRANEDADTQLSDALTTIVTRRPNTRDVVILSQPHTNYGDIVAVMDIARESGLPSASLLGAE